MVGMPAIWAYRAAEVRAYYAAGIAVPHIAQALQLPQWLVREAIHAPAAESEPTQPSPTSVERPVVMTAVVANAQSAGITLRDRRPEPDPAPAPVKTRDTADRSERKPGRRPKRAGTSRQEAKARVQAETACSACGGALGGEAVGDLCGACASLVSRAEPGEAHGSRYSQTLERDV